MFYPKQTINPINYINYFKSFIFEEKNINQKLINKIDKLFNINKDIKLLGRARSGIYLAVKSYKKKTSSDDNYTLSC